METFFGKAEVLRPIFGGRAARIVSCVGRAVAQTRILRFLCKRFPVHFSAKSDAKRKKNEYCAFGIKIFCTFVYLKTIALRPVVRSAAPRLKLLPMEHAYVIGLDYGTDSVRALLVDALTGREIDSEVALYPRWNKGLYSDPRVARFRQHPKDYLEALRQAVRAVTGRHADLAPYVRALSVDTTASTPCLTDRAGVPLSLHEEYAENPDAMFVLWKDHTGQAECEEINALCARSEINYACHSGNYYSAECFWSKVLHLLRRDEALRRDAWSVVELCDWIPAVLTGCPDAASVKMGHCVCGSKLMWAEEWGGYPPEKFFAELDPVLLPVLHHLPNVNYGCDVAAGTLTGEWASELGLPAGIPVGVGCIDSHSGAVGAGIRYGTVVLNLGTSACYMAVMPPEAMGDKIVEGIFGQAECEEINALCARSEINYACHSGNYYSAECFWSKVLHLLRRDEALRRDAWSVVELCDWIPAVLTGCPDAASVKMGHCVCGSKLMWAEEWGGYPPEKFFAELDPVLLPVLHHLPNVNYGCDVAAGTLTGEWASELGLPAGIPVGVGCIDSHSGAVGAGIRYGTVVLNLGTSACYMAVMPPEAMGDKIVEGIFGQVDGSILPRMIGFESGLSAFGDVYAWFKRLLCWPLREILARTELVDAPTRDRLIAETEAGIMDALTQGAAALPLRADAPLATDWLNGRRSPFADSSLTGTLTGLNLSTSASEIYYAFAEATAFATKHILDHMRDNGVRIDRLIGVGGIAQKSPFVMQLLADTTGMRIDVSDCKQAGAMGAVVHAATIAGLYPSVTEAQQALCAPASRSYVPDVSRQAVLNERYTRYRAVGAFTERLKNNR